MSKPKKNWTPDIARVNLWCPPPGPPSKSELAVYEKFVRALKNKKDARVLILGSTPGLRNLCLKYHLTPTSVDYNRRNFKILKKLVKHSGREKLIIADWRRLKLKEKYDLILGDVAFAMLPFRGWDKLLKNLQPILKPNGLIVQRTWMRKNNDFKNFKVFLKNVHSKQRSKMDAFTSLGIPFAFYAYNAHNENICYARSLPKLKVFVAKKLLAENDYQRVEQVWQNYWLPNSFPPKVKFENEIRKYFKIKKILRGQDWFKKYAPIYVLRKK